jgi:hypothetical protein
MPFEKAGRIASPTFFGKKWYPMTMRPAIPFAAGIAIWYWCVSSLDAKLKGEGLSFASSAS